VPEKVLEEAEVDAKFTFSAEALDVLIFF